jgi:hypothetical protein
MYLAVERQILEHPTHSLALRIPPIADATQVTIEQIRNLVRLLPDDGQVPPFALPKMD